MGPFSPLKRNHYFTGKLLTAEDFQTEQDYFLERLRRHNRFLHGWGVVSGLEVMLDGDRVLVSPGLAIDCAGNELALEAESACSLAGATPGKQYLVIRYTEALVDPLPVFGTSEAGEEQPHCARRQEAAQVELAADNSCKGHRQHGPGTPGCGQAHAVWLATLQQGKRRWKIKRTWQT